MTAYAMWTLRCDGDDSCPHGLDNCTAENSKEARSNGKEEGWTRKLVNGRMVDLCPEHSKEKTE